MFVMRNFVILLISLFLGISTAVAAGRTTPPKLAHIPTGYKNTTENWDASEEFKKLNFVQMLKDIDNYGKQVETCTDIKCCNEVTKKILNQFYPKYEKEMYENIQKMLDYNAKLNGYTLAHCKYFCEPAGNIVNYFISNDTNNFYKEYLYYMLNFLSKEVSDHIFIKGYSEEI